MSIVITGGKIVNPTGCFDADVLIEGEKIVNVGKHLSGDIRIDARGCFVLPGLVDPHVHMGFQSGEFVSTDDFETGTRAAAYGGVTTIIDFALPETEETLDEALLRRFKEASGHCYVDYEVHVAIPQLRESLPDEIKRCIKLGVSTFRLYMVYPGLELSDGELYTILRIVKDNGGMVRVHAENSAIIKIKQAEYLSKGTTSAFYHYLSRPEFVEKEAVSRLILIQRETGCPVYFNHISTAEALHHIWQAKGEGQLVFAELCPQYLFFSADVYRRQEGFLYLTSPAFKSEENRLALWDCLERNMVDAIGTDHCPYTVQQKKKYSNNFTMIPNGIPGVETTLPLLYTEWCKRGWPLEKLVALTSYQPSRIFGLYPKKGIIQPGSDADIVIYDPDEVWEIHADLLHMNVDWNPYEGFMCQGKVKTVLLRGKIIIEDGEWKGISRSGKRVKEGGLDV